MNFLIYSKENCQYCYKVKQVLELTGNPFIVYTLNEDFTKDEFYLKFGKGSTFPQVLYGEEKLGGCKETVNFLKETKILNGKQYK